MQRELEILSKRIAELEASAAPYLAPVSAASSPASSSHDTFTDGSSSEFKKS